MHVEIPSPEMLSLLASYVNEKTGAVFLPGMFQALTVVNDSGEFCAVVIVANYRQVDCEITCVSETPAAWRPHVCRAVFTYVFDTLGCARCTCITTKANRKARSFLTSLGFQLEGRLRKGIDGVKDALLYGMLRSECRFLADYQGVDDASNIQTGATGSDASGSYASEQRGITSH